MRKKKKPKCRKCTRELKGDFIDIGLCEVHYFEEKMKGKEDDPYHGIEPFEI